jgi:hypothetical protein
MQRYFQKSLFTNKKNGLSFLQYGRAAFSSRPEPQVVENMTQVCSSRVEVLILNVDWNTKNF